MSIRDSNNPYVSSRQSPLNDPLMRAGMRTRSDHAYATGGGVVYWLLVLMGVSSLGVCVLWPEWREFQALRETEHIQQQRLESLRSAVDDERKRLHALRNDPGFIDRVARRELNYRGPSDRLVFVAVVDSGALNGRAKILTLQTMSDSRSDSMAVVGPVGDSQPPPVLPGIFANVPLYDYDRALNDDRTTRVIAALSAALLAVAVLLFWPRRSHT